MKKASDRPESAPLPDVAAAEPVIDILVPDSSDYVLFADSHPYASVFTSSPWLAALHESYGLDIKIVARICTGRMVAAMPFCRLTDWKGQRHNVLPFSDFADPLIEDEADFDAVINAVSLPGWSFNLRSLHNPLPERDGRLESTGQSFWHWVDTVGTESDIWGGLDASARQNIRRARRNGVSVRLGRSLEDVRLFHRMHVHLRKSKYRLLAQPLRFFEALHRHFRTGGEVTVAIAEIDGTPLAGILLIGWNGVLYYKFNASFDTRHRPNDLLTWEVIRHAVRNGYRGLDFGLSEPDQPGLVRYKRKFATAEGQIQHHRLAGPAPNPDPDMAMVLRTTTDLMTRSDIPDTITQEAGDALYRFFA